MRRHILLFLVVAAAFFAGLSADHVARAARKEPSYRPLDVFAEVLAHVQNSYVDVTDGLMRLGDSEIHADGRFSLGYPRDDGGEEIDARFRAVRRDLDSLRHAFNIDDYSVSGRLSGEFHLTGQYERPLGFGAMTIENGAAWREPFETATASLRFDGTGVRLDGVTIARSASAR